MTQSILGLRSGSAAKPGLLVVLVVLAALLAGCVQDPENGATDEPLEPQEPPEQPGSDLRGLADLKECRGNYRGSDIPLRCENELEALEPMVEFSFDGWSCAHEHHQESNYSHGYNATLYWNPTQGQYALHYETPYPTFLSGIIAINAHDNETREFMNWDGNMSSTLIIPGLEAGDTLDVLIFTSRIQAQPKFLEDGVVHVLWSMHEDKPYPVRKLIVDNEEYFLTFAAVNPHDEVFVYQWGPSRQPHGVDVPRMYGSDYEMVIQHYQYMRTTIDVPSPQQAAC
jgi:hypothetical protein